MPKAKTVTVRAHILAGVLERMRDAAKVTFASYDRATKTYPFDDKIWRRADPYEFKLYDELRRTLGDNG